MEGFKTNKTTILLFIIIVILMGSIFYVSCLLSNEKAVDSDNSPVAPKTTKASSSTYSKLVALNTIQDTPTPTPSSSPVQDPGAEPNPSPSIIEPTSADVSATPTEISVTPTPTEILLALNSPMVTESYASSSPTLESTSSATTSLPESGFINNALIMFISAGLLIFFSFLF